MTLDLSEFHQAFYEESLEGLDVMEACLLNLSQGSKDPEAINTLFRVAHSIKGGGGMFGFTSLVSFTHTLETLLDDVRSNGKPITQTVVQLLLESVDFLREFIKAIQGGSSCDPARGEMLKTRLGSLMVNGPHGTDRVHDRRSDDSSNVATNPSGTASDGWRIRFRTHPQILKSGNDPSRLFRELATLGDLTVTADCSRLPRLQHLDPELCHLDWDLVLMGHTTREEIAQVFEWVDIDNEITVDAITPASDGAIPQTLIAPTPLQPPEQCVETLSRTKQARPCLESDRRSGIDRRASSTSVGEGSSIRVSIDKIDALINMVGELVITQSMLSQCGRDGVRDHSEKLQAGLIQLARNTRELQESVLRIRMVPISYVFNRYPRLVHDLSRKLAKKVELRVSGEKTELDKTVMEKIGDPLVHLIRNAVDHGIERPDVRASAGKPTTGVLQLNAYHQGGNIVIEVSDDGAGLDIDRIVARAQERGLLEQNEQVPVERIHELIFRPGFSTAASLSDVSGRGVGMDVVRRNIKDLGGVIETRSEHGLGSTFTIRLPLTLAILDGQLVRIGRHTYIIPLVSIVESLQIDQHRVSQVAGKAELYKLRETYLPIIRLYRLFNVLPDSTQMDHGLLVVVEGDGQKVGFYVDELLAQQQVVIKSLETNFRRVEGVSGATILGDGRVALILDVYGIIAMVRKPCRETRSAETEATETKAA